MRINRSVLRQKANVFLHMEAEESSWEYEFADNPEARVWVREQLRSGNQWAWCMVKVVVMFGDFEAAEYLSGCSYEDEAAFRACGYYEQLIGDGVEEIACRLEMAVNDHDIWEHDQVTCLICAAKPTEEAA